MSPFELLTLGPGPPPNSSIYAQNQSSIPPDHKFENTFRCEEKLWPPFVQPIEDEAIGYRSSRKRLRDEIEKLGRNITDRIETIMWNFHSRNYSRIEIFIRQAFRWPALTISITTTFLD